MDQTIAAQEIKRRGLAALDGLLERGPVYILRNNRPACVVLSPDAYARLKAAIAPHAPAPSRPDIWSLLLAEPDPPGGGRERADLDAALAAEREAWPR
jgi:PHD/YefM family antitoxin component YafN of YafNO toxin-antitoxin module